MQARNTLKILAVVAVAFGALTIFSGGQALFGGAQAQAAVGNAVGFVLWFNFLAGFVYVVAGIGLWQSRPWAAWAAIGLALVTALIAFALGVHVITGGAYEMRTVGAMVLRLGFWVYVVVMARRLIGAR